MASEIQWFIPERIIYTKLSGDLTLEDMRQDNERSIQMLDAGRPPVHGIMDDGDVLKVPLSLNDLSNTLKVFRHPGRGWLVSVDDSSRVGKMMMTLITGFFRVRYQRCQSIQEALDFLREQDESLDWSKADYSVLGEREKL